MIDFTLYTDEQKMLPAGARQFAQNDLNELSSKQTGLSLKLKI